MGHTSGSEYRQSEFAKVWTPRLGSRKEAISLMHRGWQRAIDGRLRAGAASAAAAYGPFEWVELGYLAVSSVLIVIFAGNLAHPLRLLSVQALVALLIVALCRAEANVWSPIATSPIASGERTATIGCPALAQRFWHFWRHWYPDRFFVFCFSEFGALVHFVSRRWQEATLMDYDHRLI